METNMKLIRSLARSAMVAALALTVGGAAAEKGVTKTSIVIGVANAVDQALSAKPESILVIFRANGAASIIRDIRAKGVRGPIYGYSNTGERVSVGTQASADLACARKALHEGLAPGQLLEAHEFIGLVGLVDAARSAHHRGNA